jgi:hypothetical protein
MSKRTEVKFQLQVQKIKEQLELNGLPFGELLHAEEIDVILSELKVELRERIYTPDVVVRMFLFQALNDDASCQKAVSELIAERTARKLSPCSPNTGSYCAARGRLPEELLRRLARRIGERLEDGVSSAADEWLWKGRHAKVVDGTTVSMPDTEANQEAFPQSSAQKPGLGFPIARLVVVFSLAVGTAIDMAIGPYKGKQTGETALFRSIAPGALEEGDVLTGDRYYCSYVDIALLLERKVDVVFRKHQLRNTDFRQGMRLGKRDHLITWRKPSQRPDWMDAESFALIPATLVLREVEITVADKGKRVKILTVITTLLDPGEYPKEDIMELYRQRWRAELDLRAIKSTMKMDVLRTDSPEMIRKEVWVHLLAYNLIRLKMAQAAVCSGKHTRTISFKGTVQVFQAFASRHLASGSNAKVEAVLLATIAYPKVGHRPNRYEPRAIKRRPKPHDLLKEPRDVARNRGAQKT